MCLCRPGQELITLLGQCNRLLVLTLRRVPQVAGDKGGFETGYLFLSAVRKEGDPGRLVLSLQLWACYVQLLFHSSSWEVVESLLEVSLHASMARGWLSCNGDDIFWEMMIKDWILRYITVPIFRQTHIIHTYIYIYIYLSISLSLYLSIDRSIYRSIHPSIHLSIHPSIHPSIYRSIDLIVIWAMVKTLSTNMDRVPIFRDGHESMFIGMTIEPWTIWPEMKCRSASGCKVPQIQPGMPFTIYTGMFMSDDYHLVMTNIAMV